MSDEAIAAYPERPISPDLRDTIVAVMLEAKLATFPKQMQDEYGWSGGLSVVVRTNESAAETAADALLAAFPMLTVEADKQETEWWHR